ncbi:ArsR/SmtB family transcription factor [Streptosporangium roseum]|uniref:ArsR/SmtB family transcription factor n=1 Tax=Streptosporangium roseum TaxID=2001 RepID=UPI00331C10EE
MSGPQTSSDVDAFKALAHPVRLGIVRHLAAEGEICACDFTAVFTVSQPTISAHLKVLREAGLVTARRDGNTICYALASDALSGLAGRLAALAG